MTTSMVDSAAAMRRLLDATPQTWDARARELWQPMAGMYFFAAALDLSAVHRQNFGFGPQADGATIRDALARLESADAWGRIQRAVDEGLDRLRALVPEVQAPDPTVLLVLGDPANDHFMHEIRGLSAFGGISGYIAITVWPTDEVLDRLEAIALHELHHNVRYAPGGVVWDPHMVTVGEHVVAEGLADRFAVAAYGERGLTHFVSEGTRTSDAVLHRVCEGLDVTGMADFSAWVLGDASACLFGRAPVGLPTGAGYAAGARIVQEYLDATGLTAAQCVATPAAEILSVALPRLGISKID